MVCVQWGGWALRCSENSNKGETSGQYWNIMLKP